MDLANPSRGSHWPAWVPLAAQNYLKHTENGSSIRALARELSCHPSTVMRQVRRFEGRRDDPLIDDALRQLATLSRTNATLHAKTNATGDETRMTCQLRHAAVPSAELLTQDRIDAEAKRVLRRMCEPRAVLAVAREMETAVVVRETDAGGSLRTAVVDREIAQAMALKEWIACDEPSGRINRYFITNSGRAALRRLTANDENRAQGFSENQAASDLSDRAWDFAPAPGETTRSRYHVTESPLVALSRRRDKDGTPFLEKHLVIAGEHLREDFELSSAAMRGAKSYDAILALPPGTSDALSKASDAAELRVKAAMVDLGPGLGDVMVRCCCLLEGLEVTEKALGWSARSGKIVLRIALQRLARHYAETRGQFGTLIG